MKAIADWLIHVEKISGRFYRDAAAFFDDPDIVAFLEHSAQDEMRHAEIMTTAAQVLKNHPEIKPAILVDQHIKDAIEKPFKENHKKLRAKTLTRAQLLDCIIATEYSEWNDIFLYVVRSLKTIDPQFKTAAATIQHHLKHVAHFLAASGYSPQTMEKIKKLEPVWTERILIIEDDPDLAELFETVLGMEGVIDLAKDGEAGLDKIRQHYYRLIVSDVTMPGLDGISVYRRAVDVFPGIGDRYLFITGNPDPELIAYFKTNNLRYLAKPASIHAIRSIALEMMHGIASN